ncbi:mitochondrial processing peptidase [Pseudohyphozyma bogoriensis]|nr:mitochondrial processing peptidase [Pseudohyphozyma bogoriensis]
MIDRLGFKSTTNRTAEQMTLEISQLGQQFMSSSSRDTIMYQASSYTSALPSVLSLLSDTVLHPQLLPHELDAEREAARWEIAEIMDKPALILPEVLHEVAYGGETLGRDALCPEERLDEMKVDDLKEYRRRWYRPERMVIAAAGVEHEELKDLAEEYFGDIKSSALASTSTSASKPTASLPQKQHLSTSASHSASPTDLPASSSTFPADSFEAISTAKARYVGGSKYLHKPTEEFTHLYVGYEGLPVTDEDIYVLATLQILLGGGHSFSAGGPGKGMYSRLYTHVLNLHHSVDYCQSFHHCYLDSGLFGIAMAFTPGYASEAAWILASQLDAITRPTTRGGVGEIELSRARNQLKSSLAMALESRLVQSEDLGRQVLVYGRKHTMDEMARRIDAVTLADLYRVANRVLRPSTSSLLSDREKSGRPTIVVQGDLDRVPDVLEVLKRKGLAGSPELE